MSETNWREKYEDALGVLGSISSNLGSGFGSRKSTPEWYKERILAGIDTVCDPLKARAEAAEKLLAEDSTLRHAQERIDTLQKRVEELEGDNDRLREDRRAVLNIKTTDGLTASEWVQRTGTAEAQRDKYREALGVVEWVPWVYTDREGYRSVTDVCAWCRRAKTSGHAEDCERQAALKGETHD